MDTLGDDVLAQVLDYFRSDPKNVKYDDEGKQSPWCKSRVEEERCFVEEKSRLANVLAFATCSRETRRLGLGDAVWSAHRLTMEAQLGFEDLRERAIEIAPLPATTNLRASAPAGDTKLCGACGSSLAEAAFSKKQWKARSQRRCIGCADAERPVDVSVIAEALDSGLQLWTEEDLRSRKSELDSATRSYSDHQVPPARLVIQSKEHGLLVQCRSSGFYLEDEWLRGAGGRILSRPEGAVVVQDCWHSKAEKALAPAKRKMVWRERDLPVQCCGQSFASRAELDAHLHTWSHVRCHTPPDRLLPDEYVDPRVLDPEAYASRSAYEAYRELRVFYDRVRAKLLSFLDFATCSSADLCHIADLANFAGEAVQDAEDRAIMDGQNDPSYDWDLALANCTPEKCAEVAVREIALKEFHRQGLVRSNARDLLLGGWPKCQPCAGSCSTTVFLEYLTGCGYFHYI